ncbi:inositol monophosphatase [Sphingomonas psychrotolerans]|uniref:Inositol monophosphatase n=1 Tax=Sphingomonas psychrotolerans TaxID=1327635 RepID=A0ABU3N005_9SPHN|nr:inositol monophosphatase family protein [Sphingomonas psychrotolerans]MDT8757703.1 inositol monophosphatase [Sphingomonas psychrotolerans]
MPRDTGGAMTPLPEAIAAVLRHAAASVVMPRFQRLAAAEIEEKSPGDLVTIADREAEAVIAEGLAAIRPDARFVGEEACARDPSLLDDLGSGTVWIVDPIDGTANFAAGRRPFALMAALIENGETVASCILDPVDGRLAAAERGAGAWLDGNRVHPASASPGIGALSGIVSSFSRPQAAEPKVAALAERAGEVVATRRCAGDEYPLVATGARHFALYWRSLVWDHAPGVLFLEEAGGVAARLDGSRYRVTDGGGPILLARNSVIWDEVAAVLAA